MKRLDLQLDSAEAIIRRAIAEHRPTHIFALYSGGHDSLIALQAAKTFCKVDAAVHINTTIGIEETRKHVRTSTPALGLPLLELFPPVSFRDICLQHGMPGPGAHLYCYTRLKERCIEKLVREHKRKHFDRIMLITGVRRHESRRRMGNVEDISRSGAQLWVAPCIEFTTDDKESYIDQEDLPRNPVVEAIGMSGECMCGTFAGPNELGIVAEHFPATAGEIDEIQQACAERGVHAVWGTRPPKVDKYTLPLPGIPRALPMCANCAPRKAA